MVGGVCNSFYIEFEMRSIFDFEKLYIHKAAVDMRKNINGLCVIVSEEMKLDLKSKSLFIFCNKPRTRMKILYFDRSGFALWLKKLEDSKFPWPMKFDDDVILIDAKNLELLLDGINVWTRFNDVHFEHVI
jgi:transposase